MKLSIRRGNKQSAVNTDELDIATEVMENISSLQGPTAYIKLECKGSYWFWTLYGANNTKVCKSEPYARRGAAIKGGRNLVNVIARGVEIKTD